MGVQLPGALLCSWGTADNGDLAERLVRLEVTSMSVLLPIRGTTLPLSTSW